MGITVFTAISLAQKQTPQSDLDKQSAGMTAKDLLKSPRIVAAASGAFQRVMVQANWLHQSLPKERSQMVAKSTQQAFEQLRSEVLRRQLGQ
ncbi:unnamed protein product, partial [Effrenium voratum]